MNILVSGSSGLIGSALIDSLKAGRHTVARLARPGTKRGGNEVPWDPAADRIDARSIEGYNIVVHLAGENIAGGRWTPDRKGLIRDSRVKSTRLLSQTLAGLAHPPQAFLAASAIGYYGNRGDELLTETSPRGSGFLADVCGEWEASTAAASRSGIRVANLRFGAVLSTAGGVLARMLPPFKAGLGAPVGNGNQYMSWIALQDAVRVIQEAMTNESLRGPVNVVAPETVRNQEFAATLGRVLGRPAFLRAPAFALRFLFGEMADELILASTRVQPSRLEAVGHKFLHPSLEEALRAILNR